MEVQADDDQGLDIFLRTGPDFGCVLFERVSMLKMIAVFDNGGASIDRYTIVTNDKECGYYRCLCVSDNPDWPQGVSQWGLCAIDHSDGGQIDFADLPENVQKHVLGRMGIKRRRNEDV